jgi:hypothetical protein
MGYSGAGKDTLCREMQKLIRAANVKWSRPMKDMFEMVYDLPAGFLDDPEKRLEKLPGTDISYLDVMVKAFEFFPQIDPHMMTRKVTKLIKQMLMSRTVILTDTRNFTEMYVILKFLDEGIEVIPVWINRPGITAMKSDEYQREIFDSLWVRSNRGFFVSNHTTEDLKVAAEELAS